MLETLRAVCYGRGRLEALVIARAAFELSAGATAAEEGSGIDWDYWLARWPQLERAERRRFARAELVPLLVPMPMNALGIFGSFLQAYVFTLLTTVYIGGAIAHEH